MEDSSYSDEPVVVRSTRPSRIRLLAWGGAFILVFLFVLLAVHPLWIYWNKQTHRQGPAGGVLSTVQLAGERYQLEVARDSGFVFLILTPPPVDSQGNRKVEFVRLSIPGAEQDFTSDLTWNEEIQSFGPSSFRIAPVQDAHLQIEFHGPERILWSGTRWSFGRRVVR